MPFEIHPLADSSKYYFISYFLLKKEVRINRINLWTIKSNFFQRRIYADSFFLKTYGEITIFAGHFFSVNSINFSSTVSVEFHIDFLKRPSLKTL